MLESVLDEIEQLGHIRRTALMDRFGSVSAIRKATVAEIAATPGIGEKIAAIIWNHLCALGEGHGSISGAEAVDMQTGEILEK
jgi:excinuclease ABC subunit C